MKFKRISNTYFYKALLLAASYFLAGRLGLLLAIPPGYATAIFPSSGIALGALLLWGNRFFPGVLAGSFLLNLTMSPNWLDVFSVSGLVALAIAVGSTLQAVVGASLVRHFVVDYRTLVDEKDIFKFYLVSGPLSCLISATNGTATLVVAGFMAPASLGFNWFNWWIGDLIGVFIVTPILFCFFASPRKLWEQRLKAILPILVLSFIAVVLVFFNVSEWETNKQREEFSEDASLAVTAVRNNVITYTTILESTERFISVTDSPTPAQFSQFTHPMITLYSGIQAIEWCPVVPDTDRDEVEKTLRQNGYPNFRITELGPEKQLVTARHGRDTIPIVFVEPYTGNEQAHGFDLGSNPTRLALLQKARDSGDVTGSARIKLVQKKDPQYGFLLAQPVYENYSHLDNEEQRNRLIRGYTLIVLSFNDFFAEAERELAGKNIAARIIDESDTDHAGSDSDSAAELFQTKNWKNAQLNTALVKKITLVVGGRSWRLEFYPLPNYINEHRSRQSWATLASGLVLTVFLGFILLLITGQTEKLKQNVKERTKELSVIIENIVDGIVTVNHDGIITSFNPAAQTLFGYSERDILGRKFELLLADPSGDLQKLFSPSSTDDSDTALTYQISEGIRKDREIFPIELAVSLSTQEHKPVLVAVIRDITERTRVERLKNEFISTVNHELRTPLTSIFGALSLIRSGVLGELPEQIRPMIELCYKNTMRLSTLINDFLDIEKTAAGKMELELAPQSLLSLVSHAIESISTYDAQGSVSVNLVTREDARVLVNGDRVVQVLNNFLSNAIKFSNMGGQVEVAIRSVTKDGKKFARVEVIDHGQGIPEQFRNQVFQKFSQADSSDTKQKRGTGLGLAISKELIKLMHGTIGFESEPGQGSCFYFELPVIE